MHATDPVHWQEWNAQTLSLAQKLQRPILISSGYFACHWCHVMQKENYKNLKTAALINQHFIAVKIDRELNTELDQSLIDFSKRTTGQGGWPQHVVLTPNGYPFAAFMYLPNPDLNQRLKRISELWQTQPTQIQQLAQQAVKSANSSNNAKAPALTNLGFRTQLLQQLSQQTDDFSGGLKGVAKFPNAVLLNSLLEDELLNNANPEIRTLDDAVLEWLETTLTQMQNEHLQDHIHAGFYRYTVDPEWQKPHFEKMLYDNALLAKTYLLAGQKLNRNDFFNTAQKTLNYLRSHLFDKHLGLYQSSQSAIDFNNIEGGQYLFTKQQLKAKLNAQEFELASKAWQLNQTPPYEHGWHPKPIDSELWQSIKTKLQTPIKDIPKDFKANLGWNGLMLSSLSLAANRFKTDNHVLAKKYQKQATQLAKILVKIISTQKPPRALITQIKPYGKVITQAIETAKLDDYAYIIQGLKDYQSLNISPDVSQTNKSVMTQLKQTLVNQFYSLSWQYDKIPLLPIQNKPSLKDSATPSALAYIHCQKPNSIKAYHSQIFSQPLLYASLLNRLDCKATPNFVE